MSLMPRPTSMHPRVCLTCARPLIHMWRSGVWCHADYADATHPAVPAAVT